MGHLGQTEPILDDGPQDLPRFDLFFKTADVQGKRGGALAVVPEGRVFLFPFQIPDLPFGLRDFKVTPSGRGSAASVHAGRSVCFRTSVFSRKGNHGQGRNAAGFDESGGTAGMPLSGVGGGTGRTRRSCSFFRS
jgi:hypothetical protein